MPAYRPFKGSVSCQLLQLLKQAQGRRRLRPHASHPFQRATLIQQQQQQHMWTPIVVWMELVGGVCWV
jgi:hypothetical protein